MGEVLIAIGVFLCLVAASLGSLAIYHRFPAHYREEETNNVVRLVANIFVVMTSLVLSLMINSAKGTFEAIDRDVHDLSTEMILLDLSLRHYGPEASAARRHLIDYAKRVVHHASVDVIVADPTSENELTLLGRTLSGAEPRDKEQEVALQDARQHLEKVEQLRWTLVGQSEGSFPLPLLVMLVAWLIMIFASFGYRAPRNAIVVTSFVVASALIAGPLYLILNMNLPFAGPIQVSIAPLERMIAVVTLEPNR